MACGLTDNTEPLIHLNDINSFSIIGDPGCDGLGAATMSIFAKALNAASVDFSIIAGDIVPHGSKPLYENVTEFINTVAVNPVYTLCGNHDTAYFEEYFGRKDFALYDDRLLIIALDNSKKQFSDDTLAFCKRTLEQCVRENIIIMFHIPLPNSYTDNSISDDQWRKLRQVYMPYRKKIKYFVCGHVHSFCEDEVDGIPFIITGGGGARIEFVHEKVDIDKAIHHVLKFHFTPGGELHYEHIPLDEISYTRELTDGQLTEYLETAFKNECVAHFKYEYYAREARNQQHPALAHLFHALSDSEYYHAKNHFYVLNQYGSMRTYLQNSIDNENYEVQTMYKDYYEYAKEKHHGLSQYSFLDAWNAEKVHRKLLDNAITKYDRREPIPDAKYFTCSSCGYTFCTDQPPPRCPICGAPHDKLMPCM